MAARPVQISLERDLLTRIDRDPQTRKEGRSAFIRDAVTLYLEAKRRKEIDAQIRRAYQGHGRDLLDEVEQLLEEQVWPEGRAEGSTLASSDARRCMKSAGRS